MFIAESELFKNVGAKVLEAIAGQGEERVCGSGELAFREGDAAETFYILWGGTVELLMGDHEELCFVVSAPGEVFGWSALVEPFQYRATARCTSEARLLGIGRDVIERVLKEHPGDGAIIFRNLAAIVTEKLRGAYQERVSDADLEGIVSATNEWLGRPA